MSRNHHRQKTAVALKANRARRVKTPTPSPDASGDDGYSALENLSDSDDEDEKSVRAAEREYIIKEARSHSHFPEDNSPRPLDDDEDGDDEDDGEEEEADEDEDDEANNNHDDESSWNGILSSNEAKAEELTDEHALEFAAIHGELSQSQPGRKVVRFADVPDASSDDDTETDQEAIESLFPDIFVPVNTLPSDLRREIERDANDDSDGSGATWDMLAGYEYSTAESDPEAHLRQYDTDTPIATPVTAPQGMFMLPAVSMPIQAMAQSPELDGYETDGDTTEEDVPEPCPVKKKTRRPEPDEDDEMSDSDETPIKSNKGQPRVGHFNLDKSGKKPIAVLDPITKRMLIFTPHKHRQLDLSPEQFNFAVFNRVEQSSPMGTNMSTFVMNAMFSSNTFGDFMNGPELDWDNPEALLAPIPMPANTNLGEDSFDLDLLGPDEGEKNLDISNFIKSEWSETDEEETDARPSTAVSDMDILPQLTSANVGAFRQNQITHQLLFGAHDSPDLIAFSTPFDDSPFMGLRADMIGNAGVPLSPMRRRKSSSSHPPTSPIESVLQKRKSSGDQEQAHKRQRSISDVALLKV